MAAPATQLRRTGYAAIAADTLRVVAEGGYTTRDGRRVDLADRVARCVAGTTLIRPGDWPGIVRAAHRSRAAANESAAGGAGPEDDAARGAAEPRGAVRRPAVEVTGETTLDACRRLVLAGHDRPFALNFASAKNPGGGFLGGSRAQEESLARSSALYASLTAAPEYYETNRRCGSAFYTDCAIYSPGVPVFRDDAGALLDDPYDVAFATAPAVNVGALGNARRGKGDADVEEQVERTMARRIEHVLALAARERHDTLVLGAWGCGVFRNDPAMIARLFADALAGPLGAAFARVTFAVYDDRPGQPILAAFRQAL